MPWVFNPFTGKLDQTGSGGGSATTDASLLTSGTLADARLSSNVSLDNINNNFTDGQTIAAPANTSALTASYSVTGTNTTPLVSLTGTWNTTGVARAILLNVTDTASAGTSLLIDLQAAGTSRFRVFKSGQTSILGGLYVGTQFVADGNQARVASNGTIGFSWGTNAAGSADTILARDAANTLALRNGGTAGTPAPNEFRVYNYTDAGLTNFERGFMRWNSNMLQIGTEAGGTGTGRNLSINVGGASNPVIFSQSGSGIRITARDFQLGVGISSGTAAGNALLKANGTGWQSRTGNDSAFTAIQGRLTTDTAYTATPITPTGFLTIYDSTGTAYKVACSL